MRLQLWISRDNGGGSSSNKLRTPGLNRSRLEERERLWQQQSCLNAENWYRIKQDFDLGISAILLCFCRYWQGLLHPYYFVSVCLNCMSVLTGGVTANWRIQGDGKSKLCACHLSVVTIPLFLSVYTLICNNVVVFWHDSSYVYGLCVHTPAYTCTVATWLLLDGRVSGYHELWTLNEVVPRC